MSKKLEEFVKGSIDYLYQAIRKAFYLQFPSTDQPGTWAYRIEEVFDDHVVVYAVQWMENAYRRDPKNEDEFYSVSFEKSDETYTFAAREQWTVIEMKYADKPKTVTESRDVIKHKSKRLEESIAPAQVQLLESKDEGKTRRIRINGLMEADKLNGNRRRYPRSVLESAVLEWKNHLHESAGQGRLKILTGEVEHPTQKGNKRPQFLETVVVWDALHWDGERLDIEGNLIQTSKGKDVLTLMEAGVLPGGSVRGEYDAKSAKEGKTLIEEVTWCSFTGADLVGDPSFVNAAELTESINPKLEEDMNLEELLKMLNEHPELLEGVNREALEKMGEAQLKKLEESIRGKLGIGADADLGKVLDDLLQDRKELTEGKRATGVAKAIEAATKELPYGEEGNKSFIEAIQAANPQDGEAVKSLVESKRKEYDKLFAGRKLEKMGFKGQITGVKSVLEEETGTPEFARPAFELAESYRRRNALARPNLKEPVTPNEAFTKAYLARFDSLNMRNVDEKGNLGGLMLESQHFEEAELTTDLNLQTSISRAIYEIVGPTLVAASIFDVGIIDTSPTRLFFKRFAGETGYDTSVTDEVVVADLDVWVKLAQGRLTPDTVVVTASGGSPTYEEGTDYVIDYAAGRLKALTAGSISDSDSLKVDYDYIAIRKGEMAPIERAKVTLDSMIITAAADRLADQISREAIVFSRSQLGFDAVAETMAALVQETRRIIDQGLLYAAFSAVKAVANNKTTAWTVGTDQADLDELVRLMGAAGIIVDKRFYPSSFYLSSIVNAERLSHWDGFTREGFPNAVLNAAGFAGGVNGKPIFSSTEFPDSLVIAGNSQLVMHRVFQPMLIKGPYATYDVSGGTSKLLAADQYYTEEFNVTESPINEKGAFVPVTESGS